jgi:hypothetical protein
MKLDGPVTLQEATGPILFGVTLTNFARRRRLLAL